MENPEQSRPCVQALEASKELARARLAMAGIQAPLESISNLSYLASHGAFDPNRVKSYLALLDSQVERISQLLRDVSVGTGFKPD